MKRRSVILLESAKQDLRELVVWIAREASAAVAHRYVNKVKERVFTLRLAGERGTVRDAAKGLRVIGILPNTSVVFSVDESHVYVLRVLHGGKSFELDDGEDQA